MITKQIECHCEGCEYESVKGFKVWRNKKTYEWHLNTCGCENCVLKRWDEREQELDRREREDPNTP